MDQPVEDSLEARGGHINFNSADAAVPTLSQYICDVVRWVCTASVVRSKVARVISDLRLNDIPPALRCRGRLQRRALRKSAEPCESDVSASLRTRILGRRSYPPRLMKSRSAGTSK